VGTRKQLFDILYARWYLHAIRAERTESIAMAAQLDKLARRLRTTRHRVTAASVLVRTACFDARFAETVRLMQRRLAHAQPLKRITATALGPEPVIVAITHLALAQWFLGEPERAQATARAALIQTRRLGHAFTLSAALTQGAMVELLAGNIGSGRERAQEAASLSAAHGFAFWSAMGSLLIGWASVREGHIAEGNEQIRAALDAMEATGTRFFIAFAYGFLAEGELRGGALAKGLSAVEAGLAVAQTSLDRAYTPELWRLKGELLLEQSKAQNEKSKGRPGQDGKELGEQAEKCFQRALRAARATRAKSLELGAATSLAGAWHTRGRVAPARRLLADVCAWFGARATSPELIKARALLETLQSRR
jgi:hypothetical protein